MSTEATLAILAGPPCPGCGETETGILHVRGLHQEPIVQCSDCLARVFCGVDGYRAVIPEDKAPPVRPDFRHPRPFNEGLDGINRQIADFRGIVEEHRRKLEYWSRRVREAEARRMVYLGLAGKSGVVAGAPQSETVASVAGQEVANRPGGA